MKPSILAIGLGKSKPSDDEDEAPESEDTDTEATFREAADDLMAAMKAGKADDFADALRRAIYACEED